MQNLLLTIITILKKSFKILQNGLIIEYKK